MPEVRLRHFLPAIMGSLHQQKAEGELVLEQNDGTRRLYWADGHLRYLRSDAVGEQFGNFLIRRGVLDMASLKELLADGEGARVGDRVVQWGLMTVEERDERLNELLGSVLLHATEHPILRMVWIPGPLNENLSGDLRFRLDHRWLVWDIFQNAKIDKELVEMFRSEPDWRWKAQANLLEDLSDLPLTPTLAYALSLLGNEPLGCNTIASLTGLPQDEAARLVATLWAIGGLSLVQGEPPLLATVPSPPPAPPQTPPPVVVPVPEPEMEITLVEDDPTDSQELPEPPEPRRSASQPARPMNLMDILEMDASAHSRDSLSPAGPPPERDSRFPPPLDSQRESWGPAGPPPVLPPPPDPFSRFPSKSSSNPFPPAGPPPDPFSGPASKSSSQPFSAPREPFPSGPIPLATREPFPPPGAPPSQEPFPPPSFPLPDPGSASSEGLPLMPNDDDLPPLERARRLVVKAKSYMMQSRTSEAIRALEQALKLDSDSPGAYETWMMLGRLRLTNPAWSTRAIEALQMASRLRPRTAEPWALMGELYHRKGFHANAQGCFRRALELDPSVAVPVDWAQSHGESLPSTAAKDGQSGLIGKLKGMFGKG